MVGDDNGRQKTRNHGYDIIVGWKAVPLSVCTMKLAHAEPKLKSTGAGRYRLLSRWWDAYHRQLAAEELSEGQDGCGIASRLKTWRFTPMIDRGDIRQAIDRCSNIWASLPGAGYGQFEHG